MSKGLVLCYSSYGHLETLIEAVAESAGRAGAQVAVKRARHLGRTVAETAAKFAGTP